MDMRYQSIHLSSYPICNCVDPSVPIKLYILCPQVATIDFSPSWLFSGSSINFNIYVPSSLVTDYQNAT